VPAHLESERAEEDEPDQMEEEETKDGEPDAEALFDKME